MSFSVTGIEAIQKAFRELDKKVAKKVITKAVRENLKPVKQDVMEAAPVGTGPTGEGQEHGRIKKYVKIAALKKKRKGQFGLQVQIKLKHDATDPYWGRMVESGTKFQPPQHYMHNVFLRDEAQVKQNTINEIINLTDQAIKEVADK